MSCPLFAVRSATRVTDLSISLDDCNSHRSHFSHELLKSLMVLTQPSRPPLVKSIQGGIKIALKVGC